MKNFSKTNNFLLVLLVCSIPAATMAAGISSSMNVGKTRFNHWINPGKDSPNLALSGWAEYYWKGLFPVYAGVLYRQPEDCEKQVLTDTAKRLEFHYYRNIKGSDFAQAANNYLQKNLTDLEYQAVKSRADRLNACYRDVVEGDRYSLTYIPGKGTTLALNGQALINIEGTDFQAAYLKIWLGSKPLSKAFKRKLLSRSRKSHWDGTKNDS